MKIPLSNLFCIAFFLSQFASLAQSKEHKVDSLMKLSQLYYPVNTTRSLEFAKQANAIALTTDDNYTKAKTYIEIINNLVRKEKYSEALENTNLALDLELENSNFKLELMQIKAICYSYLGLELPAKKEYFKLLELLKKQKPTKANTEFQGSVYANLSMTLYKTSGIDSALIMINKSIDKLKELDDESSNKQLYLSYLNKASMFVEHDNDSLLHYTNLSFDIAKQIGKKYFWRNYKYFGLYYFFDKDYDNAEKYFLMALEEMNQVEVPDLLDKNDIYISLAEIYEYRGEIEKQTTYLIKSQELLRKFNIKNNEDVSIAVNQLIARKETTFIQQIKEYQYYVYGLVLVFGVSFFFFYLIHTKKLNQRKSEISKRDAILTQAEEKFSELNSKLEKNNLDDLIEAAEQNSPTFLVLFEKKHPQFIQAVKSLNTKITSSELTFLAFNYLNFTTKEIASYTHVTERAVQTRKYRMRKKYNIHADIDFNVWVRSLTDSFETKS